MRFVALVSGGKDSIYSTLECIRNGHELVACVHLGRPESVQEESYMYQTAASEVVRTLVEDCLGVPLLLHQRVGRSVNTSLVYDGGEEEESASPSTDEVEDLYVALRRAKEEFKIDAVSSGAILSTYQRVRIENVCSRLGLTSMSYLWRLAPQKELLKRMLDDGIEAVIVRAACPPGLMPRKHLNKTLRFLTDIGLLDKLHERFQFHVCGEGGEYESLVIDSPLHQKKLVLDEVEIDETDDGVGDLRIIKCHAEDKSDEDIPIVWSPQAAGRPSPKAPEEHNCGDKASRETGSPHIGSSLIQLPHVNHATGGAFHLSEMMASKTAAGKDQNTSEAHLAVQEAVEVLTMLGKTLEHYGATAKDVLFVHLYLSEISHFANINAHYQSFFGTTLPPSRSCVAVGKGMLPGGRRVLLDCLVQLGSGEYMRTMDATEASNEYAIAAHATKTSSLREVLHVQSISHWAPVCVGPYSQVNTLRSGLHFMAGQIGLVPATMQLQPTWDLQLEQCWKNVAAILDCLGGGSLRNHVVSATIYTSHAVNAESDSLSTIDLISSKMIESNGGLTAGRIDALVNDDVLFGGYEDEGTWEEMKVQVEGEQRDLDSNRCSFPILVVSIPEMPKMAEVEVEIIAATKGAADNLSLSNAYYPQPTSVAGERSGWNTGHTFPSGTAVGHGFKIEAFVRTLGHGDAASALVSASLDNSSHCKPMCLEDVLEDMLSALGKALSEARTGLSPNMVLHIRLFHSSTKISLLGSVEATSDGIQIRTSLQSAVAKWCTSSMSSIPAVSVVPVHSITLLHQNANESSTMTPFALQVVLVDPVHLETDVWIHKDRVYSSHIDSTL